MKERFRRIPIELIISPAYEDRTADARLVLLSLIISPRQTPPGVYDGGLKALEYETALTAKRLRVALKELEGGGMVEPVPSGGWWVRDTFRAQCCNRDYSRAATRHLSERWPALLPRFREANRNTLNKYPPQTGEEPPTHPPQSPTGSGTDSVAVTGTDTDSGSGAGAAPKPPPATGSGSDSGGRGTGEGGSADTRNAPLEGASATASSQDTGGGNGKAPPTGNGNPASNGKLPPQVAAILDARFPESVPRVLAEAKWRAINEGHIKNPEAITNVIHTFRVAGLADDDLAVLFPARDAAR